LRNSCGGTSSYARDQPVRRIGKRGDNPVAGAANNMWP
jgi:hypothetical protein